MEKLKALFKKVVNRETILYVVFGVLTTLVSLGTFELFDFIFTKIGWQGILNIQGTFADLLRGEKDAYLEANAISWICAVIFAFFTNKYFVFESKSWKAKVAGREFATFVTARLFSFALDMLIMFLLVSVAGVNKTISKLAVQVIVVILNYIFSKVFVFRNKK